ncbi:MAG: bifunctional UDP-N-acetylmuramoyl-tripeptide:D-alanyl-D-alanine ligase/alanine racemase [Cyclobacteriaceae bacterium]
MIIPDFSLVNLASKYPGKLLRKAKDQLIVEVSIDSRKIINGKSNLFVAIKGKRFNGLHFAKDAYLSGVRNFILPFEGTEDAHFNELDQANIFLVEEPLYALHFLAQWSRENFNSPVVGITGSNGKTIVKEWLGQLLSSQYKVGKSPKSFNSQVGVPLSVLGLAEHHQVGILEAGISQPGEMAYLEKVIQPNLGIMTNIGTAHDENFKNQHQKIQEKCLLFYRCQYVIYRKEHREIAHYMEQNLDQKSLISWSEKPGADFTLAVKKQGEGNKIIMIKPDREIFTFYTSFRDLASLENIRHVIVACITLGMKPQAIQDGLSLLKTVDMRLTLKNGIKNCSIVDDTYNNDLAGLKVALEFLNHQRKKRRKVLILSDMLEEGDEESVYRKVAAMMGLFGIDQFIGVGEKLEGHKIFFGKEALFYPNTEKLSENIPSLELEDDLLLVKGARVFQFEKVVHLLEEKAHGAVMEINLNALSHNFAYYKKRLPSGTKVMVMVKAFAYGGGAAEIANHLQSLGADYLAVAYADEGVHLRQQGIHLPIMIMNPGLDSFHLLKEYQLEPTVYSIRLLKALISHFKNSHKVLNVHLEWDTGMHRLGFTEQEVEEVIALITHQPQINVVSLFSHLAGADDPSHENFTRKQAYQFLEISETVAASMEKPFLRHVLNSAGILRYPEHALDMVRLGIGLYGVEVNRLEQSHLKQVVTLKTVVSQIRYLQKGETIGYGRKGQMKEAGKIATIAIGYADGYDRRFSNGVGHVLIHQQKAPVVGNVCMDMCMVDITGIDLNEGDEVLIYGLDIPLTLLAERIGTIPYELLTKIGNRVKRLYVLD